MDPNTDMPNANIMNVWTDTGTAMDSLHASTMNDDSTNADVSIAMTRFERRCGCPKTQHATWATGI